MSDAADIVSGLRSRGLTIAVAESLTGGLLVAELVAVPGASQVVRGGVVAYATDLKASLLGVDAALLAASGPIHPDVARQLADGARTRLGADIGIATTGVAGPDPQEGHPAGHVWVAAAGPDGVETRLLALVGDRSAVQDATCLEALSVLDGILTREEPALR